MRRIVAWFLLLAAVLLLLSGCGSREEETEAPAEEADTNLDQEISSVSELQRLWEDYVYFALPAVMNTPDYRSAADIDPNLVIQYCWDQYLAEQGEQAVLDTLEPVEEESRYVYFPRETALDYVEKYFNTRELDLSRMQEETYDPDRDAFVYPAYRRNIPYIREVNAWGIELAGAVRHADGSITVSLIQNAHDRQELVEREFICTLAAREDGTLYISSGSWQFLDIDAASVRGDHLDLGELDQSYEKVVGETEHRIILTTDDPETPLVALDKQTLKPAAVLSLEDAGYPRPAAIRGEEIFLYLEGRIAIYDGLFRLQEEIGLPSALIRTGSEGEVFGLDLAPDKKSIAYTDNDGLKILDLESGRGRLVLRTLTGKDEPPDGRRNRFFYHPRFVASGSKVIVTLAGYDYNTGYLCYDLTDGTFQLVEQYFEGLSTHNLYHDAGMLSWIEAPERDEEVDAEPSDEVYKLYYFDFRSGQTNIIPSGLPEQSGDYIRRSDSLYDGMMQTAFLTYTDNMRVIHVNRLNRESWKLEPDLVQVEGANVSLLGVLRDGSILFSYYRNSAENGLCLIR